MHANMIGLYSEKVSATPLTHSVFSLRKYLKGMEAASNSIE
jgi:hypothetical protein